MDTTEKILKLVALGWDGKENELDFFQRVYGLKAEIVQKDDIVYFKGSNAMKVNEIVEDLKKDFVE